MEDDRGSEEKQDWGDETIEFVCHPDDRGVIPEPQPSSRVLPEWYKALEMMVQSGDSKFMNSTVRRCPAFLDSLNLGWILPFEADVKINTEDTGKIAVDDGGTGIVTPTTLGTGNLPDHAVGALAFRSSWAVDVPDGYSLFVVQPMNRREARYDIVGGLIDADQSLTTVEATGIWYASDSKTIIREGDPMFQVIPLKRDSRSENALVRPFRKDGHDQYARSTDRTNVNRSWYRNNDWVPKSTRIIQS